MSKIAYVVIVLGLILGSVWYVPFRLSRLLGLARAWPRYVAIAVIFVLYSMSFGLFRTLTSAVLDATANTADVLLGFHIYLTLLLLMLDALRLVIRLPDRLTAWTAVSVAVVLTTVGVWRAGTLDVNEVEIPIEGLERDVTLMHISDVHLGHQRGRAYLERIVHETNRLEPDLVLINGDLVDANSALEPGVLSALARFDAPTYFTTGNHELSVDTERALEIITSHGVRILHNEVVEIHGLQLVGLDYMNADENTFDMQMRNVNKLTIKEELPKIPLVDGKPVVLMHHSPVGLEYVSARGVALMLSGHTHAGQFFPATLITPLLFPINKGLHVRGGTYFFVSQGAGTLGPRMRLGSSNEIDLIRLKARQRR
ncbi:metallophosphoesterase [Candidatus Zixiibacteriota bacterium]